MTQLAKNQQNPTKMAAIELFATNPLITAIKVAESLKISINTIRKWRQDPNFIDACYERYMIEFGSYLPSVLNSMIREAQAGNVQAGRLVLEHSGKLVKNINITIDSPFEKFLKGIDNAEVVEDSEILDVAESIEDDFEDLPPRNEENQFIRQRNETLSNMKAIKKEKKNIEYNEKQKEWYRWRKRAEKVGVEPLKSRRPTPAQRQDWENKIVEVENAKQKGKVQKTSKKS